MSSRNVLSGVGVFSGVPAVKTVEVGFGGTYFSPHPNKGRVKAAAAAPRNSHFLSGPIGCVYSLKRNFCQYDQP